MLSPLPRHSGWAHYFAHSPSRISLPRYGSRVGLCIVLFEACSAFTRVTACTLAPSPIRDALSEGFSHFVTSIAAPVASGWSVCRVGLAPTGKRRLSTAHARRRHHARCRTRRRRFIFVPWAVTRQRGRQDLRDAAHAHGGYFSRSHTIRRKSVFPGDVMLG